MDELLAAMNDSDPSIAQAAQYGLSNVETVEKIPWSSLKSANQRVWFLAALLWRDASTEPYIVDALKDPDDRVRQMGVRATAEQGIASAREPLQRMLESEAMSPRLLGMTLATINQLNGDPAAKIDSSKINGVLLSRIDAPNATDETKATALHMLQAGHPHIPLDQLDSMLQSSSVPLQLEAVRDLNSDTDIVSSCLMQIASNPKDEIGIRAEAILGLADDAAGHAELLLRIWPQDSNAVLSS